MLDIYPDYGCTQIRVRGLRTGIEYLSCVCDLHGACPKIFDTLVIMRGPDHHGRATHRYRMPT